MKTTLEEYIRLRISVKNTGYKTPCWLWTKAKNQKGYGQACYNNRKTAAHIFSYEVFVGPRNLALLLDHLCRIRHCVNPEHLEQVTPRENLLRGEQDSMVTHNKGVCKRGHKIMSNPYFRPDGRVQCGECSKIRVRKYMETH